MPIFVSKNSEEYLNYFDAPDVWWNKQVCDFNIPAQKCLLKVCAEEKSELFSLSYEFYYWLFV